MLAVQMSLQVPPLLTSQAVPDGLDSSIPKTRATSASVSPPTAKELGQEHL